MSKKDCFKLIRGKRGVPWAGIALLALALTAVAPEVEARAGSTIEISTGLSFYQSNYSEGNYSWTRRWGASFGFHFTELTQLEFSFQDITDRTVLPGYEDTTFHDQVYSMDIVQSLTPRNSPLQPYVKAGIGQLNRSATGTYANGASPPLVVDSLTGVIGAGLRVYLTRQFAIRAEGTSYLTGGAISTWQNNFSGTLGVSLFL